MGKVTWITVFGVFYGLLVLQCSTPEEPLPPRPLSFQRIITTGIMITGESGPDLLDRWGSPQQSPDEWALRQLSAPPFQLSYPYPNPSTNSFTVPFTLTAPGSVRVWVAQASLPSSDNNNSTTHGTTVLLQPGGGAVAPLLQQDYHSTDLGVHRLMWNGTNTAGGTVDAGFYRIFVQYNTKLLWRDVYYYHKPSQLLPGMPGLGY